MGFAKAWLRRLAILFCFGLVLSACDLARKRDGTTFAIDSVYEFEKGRLLTYDAAGNPKQTKLRYLDRNTFSIKEPLAPGDYEFLAQRQDGATLTQRVRVEAEKFEYRLPDNLSIQDAPNAAGTPVVFELRHPEGKRLTGEAIVVVTGADAKAQRVTIDTNRGTFRIPNTGTYRVDVFVGGPRPLAAVGLIVEVPGTANLGAITLTETKFPVPESPAASGK